ncbi:MAG: LLM class flavin-dependent oxidoreductase [Candidatus Thorarchaeota archaeon]
MMEWGIAINLRETVSEIIEKTKIADQGGIETIWITDFPATRLSPVLASVVAKNTENSRIGVGLLSPLIYSPSHILQMMTTLIETYGERFDLLLGPGDRVKLGEIGASYGKITTLVARMSDAATSIREGLSEYKDCRVFVGAQGPKMIEASTCSDGVLLNYSDSEMIQWAISLLEGRPNGFKIGVFPPSLIGSSKSCSEHMGIKTSAAVVALGLSASIMRKFGLTEYLQSALERMKEQGLTNEVVEMLDQNILDRFSLCASVEQITERLVDYQRLGVDMVVYGPPLGASPKGVQRLVDAKNRL